MEHQVYDSLSIISAMIREYLAVFLPKTLVDTTSRRTIAAGWCESSK